MAILNTTKRSQLFPEHSLNLSRCRLSSDQVKYSSIQTLSSSTQVSNSTWTLTSTSTSSEYWTGLQTPWVKPHHLVSEPCLQLPCTGSLCSTHTNLVWTILVLTSFSCFACNGELTRQLIRVAEVVQRNKEPLPKSLDENFKHKHTLICCSSKIYALFGRLWAKKCFFELNTMFIKHEVHYFMICVAYYAESNLQISNYARKRQICRKTSKYAPDESFVANFALAERLPTSATLPLMLNICRIFSWRWTHAY